MILINLILLIFEGKLIKLSIERLYLFYCPEVNAKFIEVKEVIDESYKILENSNEAERKQDSS